MAEYDSFQYDARIHHPDLQSVLSCSQAGQWDGHFLDPVAHCGLPVLFRVVLQHIDNGTRAVINRYRKTQTAPRNEVKRRARAPPASQTYPSQ